MFSDDRSRIPPGLHRALGGVFGRTPMPRLTVTILAVGTRGDIQPFVLLGERLRGDGHRVRLATHACYRTFVKESSGLEFYPLGMYTCMVCVYACTIAAGLMKVDGISYPLSRCELFLFFI